MSVFLTIAWSLIGLMLCLIAHWVWADRKDDRFYAWVGVLLWWDAVRFFGHAALIWRWSLADVIAEVML